MIEFIILNWLKKLKSTLCLYSFKLQDYSKRDVTDWAWENVAKSLMVKGILIFILY